MDDKDFEDRLLIGALLDITKNKGKPSGGEVLLDALKSGDPSQAILNQESREQQRLANESFLYVLVGQPSE